MSARKGWAGALVLALVVPGLLAAGAAFLWRGPAVTLGAAEARAAEEALVAARRTFLAALAEAEGLELSLGPDGRPLGPFLPARRAGVPGLPGAAEEIGLALEARGRPREALAFLERAREQDRLGPEGLLALARLLADEGRGREARTLLAEAEPEDPEQRILMRLLDARIAAGLGRFEVVAGLREELLAGQLRLPAAAAEPVLGYLERLAPEESPKRNSFLAAAALFRELEEGRLALPEGPVRTREGHLVLRSGPGRLRLIAGSTVERLVQSTLIAAGQPGLHLVRGPAPPEALAAGSLEPAGVEFHVLPLGTRPSQRVLGAAWLLLGLALLALVTGLVLGLLHVRRELALSRLRLEFIDLVSHELRTPLTGLTLRTELLARGELPPGKQGAYLEALQGEVGRLNLLVERMLDFARLERGMALERRLLPARAFLAAGVRAGRPALRAAGQRLVVKAPRNLPHLQADPEVLARVLKNLLENAAKYAPRGSAVTLSARQADGCLEIDLADEGPGVPAAERQAIFTPFFRGRDRTVPGCGLGLAIVAQAISSHGGTIAVLDGPRGGALFRLRLPLAPGGADAPATDRRG